MQLANGLIRGFADHCFKLRPVPAESLDDGALNGILHAAFGSAFGLVGRAGPLITRRAGTLHSSAFSGRTGLIAWTEISAAPVPAKSLDESAQALPELVSVDDAVTVFVPPLEASLNGRRIVARRRGDRALARDEPVRGDNGQQ